MFKKFMARLAERRRNRARRATKAALHTFLRLEVLEDRLAPATVAWAGANNSGVGIWATPRNWVASTNRPNVKRRMATSRRG